MNQSSIHDKLEATETPPEELLEASNSVPIWKKVLKQVGWIVFTGFCLIFFSLMKLPEDRLKNYLDGQISSLLSQQEISFFSKESHLSFLWGVSYTLKGVTLHFPPPTPSVEIDQITVSPSLISLILGRISGKFELKKEEGFLSGGISVRGNQISLSCEAKKFDLGKSGLLSALSAASVTGIVDGKGSASGDLNVPSSWESEAQLQVSAITVGPQLIAGFSLPKISISEGMIDFSLNRGKAKIQTLRLGRSGNTTSKPVPVDDIQGTLSGEILLNQQWTSSTLNLQTRFSLSETILKSLVLLEMILSPGKQEDGSFGYRLTGTLESPIPSPLSPKDS